MSKKIENTKELSVINYRLKVLEGELGFAGAEQEKNELIELRDLITKGTTLTDAQEEALMELVFWYENECELGGAN